MFPQSPHAISQLREIWNEYTSERFILRRTDAEVSADRIKELSFFIDDIEKAIEALEKIKD